MLARLHVLSPLYLAGLALALSVPRSFENTNVARTIELGGSLTLTNTVYQVRALEDGVSEYTITLSKEDGARVSWFVPVVKDTELAVRSGFDAVDNVYYYTLKLPAPLKRDNTVNIGVGITLSHASTPSPASASQRDPVRLKFETDMLILSPYETLSQKTKIRSPTPSITTYDDPEPISMFAREAQATKSGSTVTYGPFSSVPPSVGASFQKDQQRRVGVVYDNDRAVASIVSFKRSAEISHWGSNLNIQDEVHLKNTGPTLKGHFSRVEHQQSKFYNRPSMSTITSMSLYLPPGIRDPYFYDLNGNVSTSHFRAVPSVPQGESPFLHPELFSNPKDKKALQGKFSHLEITPRYPMLGGWNYSFTLGWDSPLQDWAVVDKKGRYVVAVPFLNTFRDVAVDEAELQIILPEGATDVEVQPPFPVDDIQYSTHITFLDTIGRPAITLKKAQVTDKHEAIVYVTYNVPSSAHFKKPLAVAMAMIGLFTFGFVVRRIDPRIHTTGGAAGKQ